MGLSNKSNLLWYYDSSDISSDERSAFNKWTSSLNQSKHERFTFDKGQPDGKFYYIRHNDNGIKIEDNGWLKFDKDPGDRTHVQLEIASDGNEPWSKPDLNGRVLADKYFEVGFKAKLAPETLDNLAWVNVFQSTQVTGATTNPPLGINVVKTGGTKYNGEARWVLKAYGDKGDGSSPDVTYQKVGPSKVVANKVYDHVVKFEFADNGKLEWYLDGKLQYKTSGLLGYKAENIKPKIGVYGDGDKAISFNDAYLKYADGSSPSTSNSSGNSSSGGSSSVIDKDSGSTGKLDSVAGKGGSSDIGAGTYKLSSLDTTGYTNSGKNLLKTHGKGSFKFDWDGPDKKVAMTLKYQEENDGNPTAQIRVDGKTVDSWKFDRGSDLETHVTKLDLDRGDTVEIIGIPNAGAYARFADWIDIG
ncbi:MAG: hypothetical protein IPM60_09320 [Rhodospirillales bacterium]|nr:hypothetical protein [Rhodospirillales bacterium]